MKNKNISAIDISGLSLVELMVALAISSLLMLGLVASFKSSSDAQKELEKASVLIENGRYAINVLSDDLKHAGFFGYYFNTADPGALQDPCALTTANLATALGMPMQGYASETLGEDILLHTDFDASATTCDDLGLFTDNNLADGSDVVVVRRANTEVFTGTPDNNEVYIQSNSRSINVFACSGSTCSMNGSSSSLTSTVQALRKYPPLGTSSAYADIRKYNVHVYFVAPCIVGTDLVTDGVCTSADNADPDNGVPTLKRLELNTASGATTMEIVPLVEGVEYLKMEYGIDTSPTTVDTVTGLSGDSIPDSYVDYPTAAQWPYVVSARVFILARSTEKTDGYTDTKTYTLGTISGGTSVPAASDGYRRHVFSAEVRPMNLAGRREIPE